MDTSGGLDARGRRVLRAAAVAMGMLAVGRMLYVLAESRDAAFGIPMLDGAYYVEWARAIAGGGGPPGAFYLAPLYPYALAGAFVAMGERWVALYGLQQALVVVAAVLLGATAARTARASAGFDAALAGVAAAGLALLYHPLLFFAARPVGEVLAIALLAGAVRCAAAAAAGGRGSLLAGMLCGLAALGRPNLLLVGGTWLGIDVLRGRWRAGAALGLGLVAVLAPATLRNWIASGHLVPVSSNAGITLYHGNGPGALGVFTPPEGFSGSLATQREEATALARIRSGRALDPVEADRWWRDAAVRARLEDPAGTLRLLGTRLLLLLDNHEHGLDYAPALDRNPFRHLAPVPFALLLGLACAGVVLCGFGGTGGERVWGAIAACAATPLVFFASSRYRLPASALLAVPAGIGLAELLRGGLAGALGSRRKRLATIVVGALAAGSLLVPSDRFAAVEEPMLLANRAAALRAAGDLDAAERSLRRALEIDPSSALARFNLGVILERTGRTGEAEESYRRALEVDPGRVEAAGNLGGLLILGGDPGAAIPILRAALERRPTHAPAWTNLVVALIALGDAAAARDEARRAAEYGVALGPELLEALEHVERSAQ